MENKIKILVQTTLTIVALFLLSGIPSYSAPQQPFAPNDARYVVTQLDPNLTSEVLVTQLDSDIIASSSNNNVGSSLKPWGNIYGLFGQFGEVVSNVISSMGSDQSLFLNPTGTGKVIVGGDSLVVASKTAPPSSPVTGQIYFDTTLGAFRGYNGISWVDLSSPVLSSLANSLVSYWKLDGTGNDSVDANDLTENNGPSYTTGKINNAIDLESDSNQYLSRGDNSSLSIIGSMSVSFWVKLESQPATNNNIPIISKYYPAVGSDQRSWNIYYEDVSGVKKIWVAFVSEGTGTTYTGGYFYQTLSSGTWYHIVAVFNVSTPTVELYINGSSIGTLGGSATSIFDSTAPFLVGSSNNGLALDGIIDEIGLWSRILSASEVTELYNSASGLSYPF